MRLSRLDSGGGGARAMLILAVVAAVTVAGAFSGVLAGAHPVRLGVFAALVLVAVAVVRRPMLGLALAAATDVTVYYTSGLTRFPPRVYLVVIVFVLGIPRLVDLLRTERWARRILAAGAAMVLLVALVDTVQGTINTPRRLLSRYVAAQLILASLLAHIRTVRDLRIVLFFLLGATAFSALIGILQYHHAGIGWDLRIALSRFYKGGPAALPIGPMAEHVADITRGRIVGMAANPIDFSYHLVLACGFALALLLEGELKRRYRLWLLAATAIFCVAVVESLTRSAILALWVTAITVAGPVLFRAARRRRGRNLAMVLGAVFVLITLVGAFFVLDEDVRSARIYTLKDAARPTLYRATLRVIIRHPFGVGTAQTPKVIAESFSDYADLPNAAVLLEQTGHNYFLNAAAFWGWLGLVLVVLHYVLLWRSGRSLALVGDRLPIGARWLPLATRAHIVGYVVQCFFHNAGPFNGDLTAWYYIGMLVAGHALARSDPGTPGAAPSGMSGR